MANHALRAVITFGAAALGGALILATTTVEPVRAQAKPAIKCAALLTADEVTKAIGVKMDDMGPEQRGPGESSCPWMLRGAGFKTVNVQFYEPGYIKESPAASTPDAFFELMVSGTESAGSSKREMLPGIGVKAAFVPADPQVAAYVLRADGVARIVGNNLTKAQITAVARAVATP